VDNGAELAETNRVARGLQNHAPANLKSLDHELFAVIYNYENSKNVLILLSYPQDVPPPMISHKYNTCRSILLPFSNFP
jgi:hypothetical protein